MKLRFIAFVAILAGMLYGCAPSSECSSCGERTRSAGDCSYCGGDLCSDCLPYVTSDIEADHETHYDSGYSDGYEEGEEDGYSYGHEEGYNDGYFDGYDDGYYDNDELYFWQNNAVIVTTTGEKYHSYDCYHIEGRRYYIYNIELARAKGYTACLDCIEW